MEKRYIATLLFVMLLALSGCLYPEERLQENRVPYLDQLQAVQGAVDQYKQQTDGLLPIKTRDMHTPIYRKYPIDFNKLIPKYIQDAPGNAFENGGTFQYVLVDVEENPTVKLIDLRLADQIRELKLRVNLYRQEHGYPPFQTVLVNDRYTLDYEKLGYQSTPMAQSPYSDNYLPFLIDSEGEIYVDYGLELNSALKKHPHAFKPGDDIREILVQHSSFVPAYSVPYTIKDDEPVFLIK